MFSMDDRQLAILAESRKLRQQVAEHLEWSRSLRAEVAAIRAETRLLGERLLQTQQILRGKTG
jgi:hypothetical protein